jgi:hypothetical protein
MLHKQLSKLNRHSRKDTGLPKRVGFANFISCETDEEFLRLIHFTLMVMLFIITGELEE